MPSDSALVADPAGSMRTYLQESIGAIGDAQEALDEVRARLELRLLALEMAGDPALDVHEAEVQARLADAPDDPFPDAVGRDALLREATDRFGS